MYVNMCEYMYTYMHVLVFCLLALRERSLLKFVFKNHLLKLNFLQLRVCSFLLCTHSHL